MFKHRAEEYADSVDRYEIKTYSISDIEQAFQKGSDCGYNKANEWYSVYDELPKEKIVLTSSGEPKVNDCVSVSWAYSDDILVWKIVT